MLGLAEEVFARTIEYLQDRKQFGVPVGSFQGLQHRAAILYSELDLCRSAVLHALRVLDSGTGDIAEVASMCKAKLCETAHKAATEGIQMHGGIGMTDECEIGFFLKRCQILETIYGDRYFHIDRFARLRGY
jgi:acyl-CoA dehydrogenase